MKMFYEMFVMQALFIEIFIKYKKNIFVKYLCHKSLVDILKKTILRNSLCNVNYIYSDWSEMEIICLKTEI